MAEQCIVPVPDRDVNNILQRFAGEVTVLAAFGGVRSGNLYDQARDFGVAVLSCKERTSDGECNAGCNGKICPVKDIEKRRKTLVRLLKPDPGNRWQ